MIHLVKLLRATVLGTLFVLLAGCGGKEPVTVNFVLNNQDIQPAIVQPTELSDTASLLTVNVGDSIYLVDFSEPLRVVKTRSWDLTGDGNPEVEDAESLYIAISESGFNKITLCVNGPENCVSKWIYAKSVMITNDLQPKLTVMNHQGTMIEVPNKKFHLEIETENVQSPDEISVEVNSEPISKFDFTDGLIIANLSLPKYENYVDVIAETNHGRETVNLMVENLAKKPRPRPQPVTPAATPRPPVTPPPPPSPKIVLKQPTQLNSKTPTNSYPVVMQTRNINDRAELVVFINNARFTDFSFIHSEISFTAPLKQEINSIVVSTRNGRVKRELIITRQTTQPEPDPKPVVVVPDPVEPVMSASPKGGVAWAGPGKLSQSALGSCTNFNINSGAVRLSPKQKMYLLGTTVYASSCGSVTFTLSQNKAGTNGKVETREIREGLNVITFDVISDTELAPSDYYLSYTTGTSGSCGEGTPQLLDGSPCGKASSGDSRVGLRYDQNAVGIFQFKYEY